MLHQPEAHEPLTGTPWNDERARVAIRDIVADADASMRGRKLMWRAHEWDGWHGTSPMKNLYVGAAGVILGLDLLRRRGHAATTLDLRDLAVRTLELFRERPDYMKGMKLPAERDSALLTGEAGILLVAYRLGPSRDLADALHERVRANVNNEADEVMWGAPGTLIAARAMLAWTADTKWRDAWNESADALWLRRDADGFWVQRMYGQEFRGLGPAHGVVGNVQTLLPLLDDERSAALRRDTSALLERTAFVENGHANWPYRERPQLAGPDGTVRLQWCCGAPGIVASAAGYLDEDLLLAGARLAWDAGPPGPEKAGCICHGAAGTGYAFLKVFDRTGDEEWLTRARRFAMHALEQVAHGRSERGSGRHSLFTGDIGVALFAADCLDARTGYPVLDALD